MKREICVYAHWAGMEEPELVGTLLADQARGKHFYTFSYDDAWLRSGHREMLDPDLNLYGGTQFRDHGAQMFGMFLDSAPDRWGRILMQRREQILAREKGRTVHKLSDLDFFLGVSDLTRMGGLRYTLEPGGPFIAVDQMYSCPPIAQLRKLQQISLDFEGSIAGHSRQDQDDPVGQDDSRGDENQWIQQLCAPGSSLGGARPKSNVKDSAGVLWIAKFPGRDDLYDIGGWEMVAHRLARDAGLAVPEAEIMMINSPYHTYLVKRFDRDESGARIHFASAMTLLGYKDGADYSDGASYLELAELIMQFGADPEADLLELWKRIVFSVCIANTDDHLRNHGFLLTSKGWKLSPAFDLNPSPGSSALSLAIDEVDNSLDLDLVHRTAPYFRIDSHRARMLIEETLHAVSFWKRYADEYGIPSAEQDVYAAAFTGRTS